MPTGRNLMAELLSAVDLLTKRRVDAVIQETEDKQWLTRIESDGLLKQLREAITSTVGSHPVGGSLPNQRSVLDGDAMEKYDGICKEIVTLYGRVTSARPFPLPESNLRHWYIEINNQYRSGRLSDDSANEDIRKLEGWVKMIDEKLNPATTLDIIAPCPNCGNLWAESSEGDKIQAIVIIHRPGTGTFLQASKGVCRACDKEWHGAHGLRYLRTLIDDKSMASVD